MDNRYQVMPELAEDDYHALRADIAARGVMVPVEYDEDGNILDGYNRVRICQELGITDWPRVTRTGLTEEQKLLHARKLNLARRHLTREQRQGLIKEQLKATPEFSDRQIARELNVSDKTVGAQRKELEAGAEIPHLNTSIGADGKEYPRQPEKTERPQPVMSDPAPVNKPHVVHNSGNNEWYTPESIVSMAREFMGDIDLDPASSDIANEVVKATYYFTADYDGLSKEWGGRVWMNPPYSGELIGRFCEKLTQEYMDGNVTDAIVLVNNATETAWFQDLALIAGAICFPRSRVKFWNPSKETASPLQGQALLYMGQYPHDFCQAFRQVGVVALLC